MNGQITLDAVINPIDSFWKRLQSLLDELILSNELPENSIHIYSNLSAKGKKSGQETSKSICIYEPDYPAVKNDINNPGRNLVIMNIQDKNGIELLVRNSQYELISAPETANVKSLPSDKDFKHVLFSWDDDSIYDYIKNNIIYCLKTYHSNAKSFGCCSRFIECSDAMKCVHENKLYSTACSYRKNLENGKIFYGKNNNNENH